MEQVNLKKSGFRPTKEDGVIEVISAFENAIQTLDKNSINTNLGKLIELKKKYIVSSEIEERWDMIYWIADELGISIPEKRSSEGLDHKERFHFHKMNKKSEELRDKACVIISEIKEIYKNDPSSITLKEVQNSKKFSLKEYQKRADTGLEDRKEVASYIKTIKHAIKKNDAQAIEKLFEGAKGKKTKNGVYPNLFILCKNYTHKDFGTLLDYAKLHSRNPDVEKAIMKQGIISNFTYKDQDPFSVYQKKILQIRATPIYGERSR